MWSDSPTWKKIDSALFFSIFGEVANLFQLMFIPINVQELKFCPKKCFFLPLQMLLLMTKYSKSPQGLFSLNYIWPLCRSSSWAVRPLWLFAIITLALHQESVKRSTIIAHIANVNAKTRWLRTTAAPMIMHSREWVCVKVLKTFPASKVFSLV